MKSKEKSKEEIVLIRYYNVLFYLVFKGGIDDFNRQCLVNRINTGESIRMKQIQKWCHYHQITYRTSLFIERIFLLKPIYGTYILTLGFYWKTDKKFQILWCGYYMYHAVHSLINIHSLIRWRVKFFMLK